MSLAVGDRFESFKELQTALENYENQTFTKLWKRDSRTIGASRISRKINDKLIYYEVRYACIHGGRIFQSVGKGTRETSTFKKDCPVYIQFRASSDGNTLEVKAMESHHNHETSKVTFMHYPNERRLSSDVRNEAKDMLAMKANKKILQQKLQQKTGKIITLRDLTNIQASLNKNKDENLENCIHILKSQYGANVSVLQDEKQNFQGLFVQTEPMKKMVSTYPEFLAIDATYKLLRIQVPVYLIMTEDGACQSEIVAMCLLTNEDQQTLSWFLSTFKENNPQCENTKCIITDKDMNERQVIRQIFPNASLIICVFHSLKTFRREVTCEKLAITQSQRLQCLELLQKLVFAYTDEQFEAIQTSFYEVAPKAVQEYYNKNWRDIKNEWNMNENFLQSNFLNNTNNRLECLNSKLKSVISKNSSLEDFIHGFFTIINVMQQERDHKAIYNIQKQTCLRYPADSDQYKYRDYLTREAAKYVIKEIDQSDIIVRDKNFIQDGNHFQMRQGNVDLDVTETSCSCAFFIAMLLPCRHIFAVKKYLNHPIFDEALVDKRWTLRYFKANHRVFIEHGDDNNNNNDHLVITTQPSCSTLSYAQKRKKALSRTDVLADLCAQRSNMLYEQRTKILDDLIRYWKAGNHVSIHMIDNLVSDDQNNNKSTGQDELNDKDLNQLDIISLNDKISDDQNNNKSNGQDDSEDEDLNQLDTVSLNDKINNNQMSDKSNLTKDQTIKTKIIETVTDAKVAIVNSIPINDEVNNVNECNDISELSEVSDTPIVASQIQVEHTTIASTSTDVQISTIKMPVKVKQRGRPKGQNVTVIGLPKKKNKPLPYTKLAIVDKQKFLLDQLVNDSSIIITTIRDSSLIEEKFVESRPEKISHAILDGEVDVFIIRQFFTHDAWKAVLEVTKIMKKKAIWICPHCYRNTNEHPSICCDRCLLWQHLKCVNLKTRPKPKLWFCKNCYLRSENTA